MQMVRMLIQLPPHLKSKLDVQRKHGTTASGFIRHLPEREFTQTRVKKGTEQWHDQDEKIEGY